MQSIVLKNSYQIEGIRRSCKLAARTLDYITPFVKEGISTNQINDLIEKYIREHKAIPAPLNYNGFPKASCTAVNEVVCHGIPDDYVLKNGDIIGIDVTTILNGFYGDTAVTLPVGEVSEETKHLLEVTKKCLDIGIRQVAPGKLTGEIGYHIGKYALLQGCSVVEQYCGHGVGLEFHEPPQIVHICEKTDGVVMYPGMIFTVEPMINLGVPDVLIDEYDGWTVRTEDGKYSAQFEHTILVTKTGFEILTLSGQ